MKWSESSEAFTARRQLFIGEISVVNKMVNEPAENRQVPPPGRRRVRRILGS